MKINVTENKVSIKEEQILNENEYNIHKIQFDFSSEYTDDLVKVALFSIDNHTYKKIISNNECDIPPEVLTQRGYSILGVYAYKTEQDTLVLRYSPSPTRISVYNGSYKADAENSEPITPSEIEQYQQILQNSLQQFQNQYNALVEETEGDIQAIEDELQRKVDEGYFDGEDGYTPQKGIDYFTEQDIEEIEGDILNEVYTKSETDTLLQEKADVEDIPDVSSFITKDVNNLTNYTLKTNTGSLIDLEINDTTYVVTLKLKNQDGTVISTDTIDLPLESVVVSGRYDNTTKKVILTLENGSEVDFSVADLVAGLQTEITSQNKLASDLIDDTNSGNKFVTTTEKQTWNNKYDKPNGGIPKTDLASTVQTSLNKADTAIQEHQDISGKEDKTNKVTSIDNTSTDTQYPSAKCVYDSQEEQNTEIENLQAENERLRNTLPTTTGEGQDITLNKTAELEFKKPPLPMGNSEQEGEPSPDNEVPISNVTGDVEVVVGNKNFFVPQTIVDDSNNAGVYLTNDGYIRYKTGANSLIIKPNLIKENIGYTFKMIGKSDTNNKNTIRFYAVYTDGTSEQAFSTVRSNTEEFAIFFTTNANKTLDFIKSVWTDELVAFIKIDEAMILEGVYTSETIPSYVPHREQVFTFPLGNEKLMLGDYLADDGIHHVRGQKVYNGSEDWIIRNDTSTNDFLCCRISGYLKDTWKSIFLCSHFEVKKSADSTHNNIRLVNADGYGAQITISRNIAATVNDFKNWLTEQYNNNSPVIVEYELNEEVIVPYTSAQQTVYKAIKQALSYEEQTKISSNQNAIFNVEAYQDAKVILAEKGTYSKPSTGIPKSDLASAVQTSLNKADTSIQQHQDISGKQDKTDNNLTTINKTIVGAINEVDSIAKGANQALSYGNYSTMITAFNNLANDIYNIGQNIMIITLEVPDLWISSIESTSSTYTYVDDETFVNELKTNGYVQVGYYKLSALETQKVNLDDYVTKTENKNKADIINNELTGSTIYFTDGINNSPVNKLIVNIEPVQEGSGTPTPNNVRNIIGWNAAIINYSGADTQNPNVLNVSWQNEAGIVYGGILDVTTGLLTVTKALVELAVEDMNNTETYPGWKNTGIESIIGVGINQKFTSILNIGDTFSANTTSGTGTIFLPRSAYNLTQEQWKEQYPNLTIQIIAEYQNPETYQLTPHEIRTLLGTNNFWANTGDVTVNYKADTKLYIDSKFQSLEDRLSLLEG